MTKRINYGDSIYLLHEMIGVMRKALSLEIESRIFLDKVVEDIFFVDRVLENIYEALKQNRMLIIRDEHLRQILRAKQAFSEVLDTILSPEYAGTLDFRQVRDKLHACVQEHRGDVAEIRRIIEEKHSEPDSVDQISTAELEFLLGDSDC